MRIWKISLVLIIGAVFYLVIGLFTGNIVPSSDKVSKASRTDSNVPVTQQGTIPKPLVAAKQTAQEAALNRDIFSDQKFVDTLAADVVPPLTVDFISRDPKAFGEYTRLLNQARQQGSKDSITELVDFGTVFLDELMLHDMSYEDVVFVLDFCKKIRKDLKTFEGSISPEFIQIALAKVRLTEYHLPRERAALLDPEISQKEFAKLRNLKVKDPVLERQRRYLMFLAQTDPFIYRNTDMNGRKYYDYDILRNVRNFPDIDPNNSSVREQIIAEKIRIAAHLEYARRDFTNSSKDLPGGYKTTHDEEILNRYHKTLSEYERTVAMADSLIDTFGDKLNEGDKRHLQMLKQRFLKEKRRIPWRY